MLDEERTFKLKNGDKIRFIIDWIPEIESRGYTLCILETKGHKFYSGIAVVSPEDCGKTDKMTGRKISLQRACNATIASFIFNVPQAKKLFREVWSEIRFVLRQERLQTEEEKVDG